MDINWLQDFLALAETRHFTHAAGRRNVSQAAFSRRIRSLENWLGVSLIERGSVPAHLTPAGRRFEVEARATLTRLLDARAGLAQFSGQAHSSLSLSIPLALASARLARWSSDWFANANITLNINTGNVEDVVSAFSTGHTDMLICHQSERFPISIDERYFLSHVVEADRLCLVESKNIDGSDKRDRNTRLEQSPLLMYPRNTFFGRVVSGILEQANTQLFGVHAFESDSASLIAECAAIGMGLGWVPETLVRSSYAHQLLPVDEPTLSTAFDIVAYVPRNRRSYACDFIWEKIIS